MNIKLNHHIIPFRGEYFELPKNKSHLVRSMVYPIPNPNLPFLGIHLTRTVNNKIILGPNAVLAPGKEAYSNKNINVRELSNILLYKGFWKMVYNNYNIIEEEILQSIIRTKFLEKVCDLLPGIKINELIKNSSGIRAQLVGNNGELMDDFGLVIAVKHQTSPKLVDWLDGQSLKMLQVYSVTVPYGHEDWVNAEFFRIRSKA